MNLLLHILLLLITIARRRLLRGVLLLLRRLFDLLLHCIINKITSSFTFLLLLFYNPLLLLLFSLVSYDHLGRFFIGLLIGCVDWLYDLRRIFIALSLWLVAICVLVALLISIYSFAIRLFTINLYIEWILLLSLRIVFVLPISKSMWNPKLLMSNAVMNVGLIVKRIYL